MNTSKKHFANPKQNPKQLMQNPKQLMQNPKQHTAEPKSTKRKKANQNNDLALAGSAVLEDEVAVEGFEPPTRGL